jgi:hypothetical protein
MNDSSSGKLSKEELLEGLELLQSVLKEEPQKAMLDIPTLNDVVLEPGAMESGEPIELADLDNIEDNPGTDEALDSKDTHSEQDIPELTDSLPPTVDQLLSQAISDITEAVKDEARDNRAAPDLLLEALQIEAETIRDELLLKYLPKIEQQFRERLAETTSELLKELIAEKEQEKLRDNK